MPRSGREAPISRLYLSKPAARDARRPAHGAPCREARSRAAALCGVDVASGAAPLDDPGFKFLLKPTADRWSGVAAFGARLHGAPFQASEALATRPEGGRAPSAEASPVLMEARPKNSYSHAFFWKS